MAVEIIVEGVAVGVVLLLEGVGRQANGLLALLLLGDCTFVDHISSQAAGSCNYRSYSCNCPPYVPSPHPSHSCSDRR